MFSSETLVLLLTIDSLRGDHLGCYGCSSVSTPFIDRLAYAGAKFVDAFSQGGGTPESFPSIMCSLPPPLTLEQRNVLGAVSLAHSLKERAFKTAGFHSNPFLSSRFGYSEGFDTFCEGEQSRTILPNPVNDLVNATDLLILNRAPITDAQSLVRRALRWADSAGGPAFLWVHFMDTHFPYLPPLGKGGLLENLRNRALWLILMERKVQNKRTKASIQTLKIILRSYKKCIELVDEYISILVTRLLNRFTNCHIILVSDHGEAFWEHGYFGHSGLYEEILRVPLIVYSTGQKKVRGVVRGIFPLSSIMTLIVQLLEEGPICTDRITTWAESESLSKEEGFLCSSLDPPFNRKSVGLRTRDLKYIRNERLSDGLLISEELYDLSKDPSERVNLASSHQEELLRMRSELDRLVLSSRRRVQFLTREDEREISQRLRSLGYE